MTAVSATIIIGDVHGCADELSALLRACAPTAGDAVVLVGDLVAKGPDSRGVLAIVRESGARAVCGNHDARVLSWRTAQLAGQPEPQMSPAHAEVARSLDDRDWQQLGALPLYLRVPEHNVLVVHAGLMPGVPIEAQEPNMLMNLRSIRADGSGTKVPNDGVLWGSLWQGPELVLFGHHASQGLQQHPLAIGLDTGCVYGRELTAYVLPEGRFVSVPARRQYASIDRDSLRGDG
jgi:hypothetical protein